MRGGWSKETGQPALTLLPALAVLPQLLRELDLSHDSSKDEGVEVSSQQPVNATAIHAMACITSLTSIDLSR